MCDIRTTAPLLPKKPNGSLLKVLNLMWRSRGLFTVFETFERREKNANALKTLA